MLCTGPSGEAKTLPSETFLVLTVGSKKLGVYYHKKFQFMVALKVHHSTLPVLETHQKVGQ
jgi:hypothetical protein